MQDLRFALIGAGFMGAFHGRTLASIVGGRLAVVVDADVDAAAKVAAWAPSAVATADAARAFADDVDAVVIATPAQTHASLIDGAVAAGKAIFCEKPLDTDLERAIATLGRVEELGVPLQMGFQRRYDPGVARLLATIDAGELGTLETFRSVTCDPYGPDFDGMLHAAGIFHDTLSHDVDLALRVCGPVRDVFTRGSCVLDPRFEALGKPDTTIVSIRFESGVIGTIENRLRSGYGYETLLEVGGSIGKGVVRDDRRDGLTLHRMDRTETAFVPWFLERFDRAYRAELEAFVDALRTGRDPDPDGAQGLDVMRLCQAAERSYLEDRRVALDEIRDR